MPQQESNTKKNHIWLIDDSTFDLYMQTELLENANPENIVVQISNPLEALNLLEGSLKHNGLVPDLILLDINMPQMDGFQFLEKFEALPESIRSRCTIYLVSANDASDYSGHELSLLKYKFIKNHSVPERSCGWWMNSSSIKSAIH